MQEGEVQSWNDRWHHLIKQCKKMKSNKNVQSHHAMTEGAVLKVMQEEAVLSCNAEGALDQRSYFMKGWFYHAVPVNTVNFAV
jgi:hypothetical protein